MLASQPHSMLKTGQRANFRLVLPNSRALGLQARDQETSPKKTKADLHQNKAEGAETSPDQRVNAGWPSLAQNQLPT